MLEIDEFAVVPLLHLCRAIHIRNKVKIIVPYSVLDFCLWLDANNDDLE